MVKNNNIVLYVGKGAMVIVIIVLLIIGYMSYGKLHNSVPDIDDFTEGWTLKYTNEYGDVSEQLTLPTEIVGDTSMDGYDITNTLPDKIVESTCMFVHSYHQEIDVYVNGELRNSNHDYKLPFGTLYPSSFTTVELCHEDAGAEVTIHYDSASDIYRNDIRYVYIGSQLQFVRELIKLYGFDILFGFLYIAIGIAWLTMYIALCIVLKRRTVVDCLGYFALVMGFWILCNSEAYQLIFNNPFFADKATCILLSCLMFPCIRFCDGRQDHRYSKLYTLLSLSFIINIIVQIILDLLSISNMCSNKGITHVLILVCISSSLITIWSDIRKGYDNKLIELMISVGMMLVATLIKFMLVMVLPFDDAIGKFVLYIAGILMMCIMGIGNLMASAETERLKTEANNANKAKSDFLANMSHEIRTPISAVLGMNEMILRETDSEYIRTYSNKIKNAGNVLLSIVNDILDFSKIESGKMELVNSEYESVPLFIDVVNMMRAKAEDKGLELKVDVDGKIPCKMYGDDMRVRQIITNILSNAVKYTRKGSVHLSIEAMDVTKEKVTLRISVEDTGIGIKSEDMEKLFESFKRLDEKHNRTIEGTGLGMSITTHYLRMMGSELNVDSVYGKGSTFWFDLEQDVLDSTPINDFEKAYKEYEARVDVEHNDFIAPEAKVLVVDDNEMNLEVIEGLLKETQIQVVTADRGPRALELIRNYHYDLILMDHMMPGMDGIETLEHIRNYEKECVLAGDDKGMVPVVILTANAISGAKEMYIEKGFQDYLVKPIQISELARVLKNYIPSRLIKPKAISNNNVIKKEQTKSDNADKKDILDSEYYLKEYGISIEDGVKYSANKVSKYKMMLGVYLKFDKARREKLSGFIDAKDMEGYAIEVHALKSNARGIGANNLADIALAHETNAKEKNYDYVSGNYDLLTEEMEHVIEGVKEILSKEGETPKKEEVKKVRENSKNDSSSVTIAESIKSREKRYKILMAYVNDYDRKEALIKVDEWINGEIDENIKSRLNDVRTYLSEFEFEKAINDLKVIGTKIKE